MKTVLIMAYFITLLNPKVAKKDAVKIAFYTIKCSSQYKVDKDVTVGLFWVESRFNKKAISRRGARGLGQLTPATARKMGVKDSFDIEQNVCGSVKYIDYLRKYYKKTDYISVLNVYLYGKMRSGHTFYTINIYKMVKKWQNFYKEMG